MITVATRSRSRGCPTSALRPPTSRPGLALPAAVFSLAIIVFGYTVVKGILTSGF